MGPSARPATGLLLKRLATYQERKVNDNYHHESPYNYYNAISSVALGDPQAIAFFKNWARPTFGGTSERSMGIRYLVSWAGLKSERRQEIAKLVLDGIADRNGGTCLYCAQVAGDYGALSKIALPTLVRMKQSPDANTRAIATKAVEQITTADD